MITSTSNAQIKELAKLQKKSRLRDERRIFLVEGPRMVEEIPKERIERLYISESFERKNPAYIRELGMPAEVLSDPVFHPFCILPHKKRVCCRLTSPSYASLLHSSPFCLHL